MSKLNICCLLAPMVDTEGPMSITGGNALEGPKKIMGKYGEIGLETAITLGADNPNQIHLDILSIGKAKEVTSLQQTAIAMIQPKNHPGTLGVHALELEDIDNRDAFSVARLLVGMINKLENKPHVIFAGRESNDYSHGVVGPVIAQALGVPYYSGLNEIKFSDDYQSAAATFHEGNDKLVFDIKLPAVFGTIDWLNGKDTARFTSLKGVMMAKKFDRNVMALGDLGVADAGSKTAVTSIEQVQADRKNRRIEEGEGVEKAEKALDFLINTDKAMAADGAGGAQTGGDAGSVNWSEAASVDMSGDLVVLADHDGSSLRLSTLQVLSQARAVADALGKKVTLLILGKNAQAPAAGAAGHGVDQVAALSSDKLEHPTVEAVFGILKQIWSAGRPGHVFLVANDLGRDLGALLAAEYNGGLLQDLVAVGQNGGRLNGKRVISNARYISNEEILEGAGIQVASLRSTAFDPAPHDAATSFVKLTAAAEPAMSAVVKEFIKGVESKGIPLNEAKIIVSGGRGMKDAANFAKLEELARILGGAVGASRAVTDLGWVPHNLQIGQTGTTVAPDIYIAVGISGAIQHLTGMSDSKYIIAINSDAEAPIHKHADISIVDQWQNVMEPLIEAFKKALGK